MRTFKFIAALTAIAAFLSIILYLAPTKKVVGERTYQNEKLGLAFTYPAEYVVQEAEVGSAERQHYSVIVMNEKDLKTTPTGGEGPTAISFDFYQNNLDKLSVVDWVTKTSDSNYTL